MILKEKMAVLLILLEEMAAAVAVVESIFSDRLMMAQVETVDLLVVVAVRVTRISSKAARADLLVAMQAIPLI